MRYSKIPGLSVLTKQITSTVSVALVLLILGIVASMGIVTRGLSREIKENVGFVLSLNTDVPAGRIDSLNRALGTAPYTSRVTYTSARQQLDEWAAQETDTMMVALMTADPADNPFFPEFEVMVREQYASSDSINRILATFKTDSAIAEIQVNNEMVDRIDRNFRNISYILIAVAAALLLISCALINNTIRLTVYAQRFTIHTMQLVGATRGFIRRPIVMTNIMHGVVAAAVAVGLLTPLRYYAASYFAEINSLLPWQMMLWVFAGMLLCGILICAMAAIFATNKHLSQEYDEMF